MFCLCFRGFGEFRVEFVVISYINQMLKIFCTPYLPWSLTTYITSVALGGVRYLVTRNVAKNIVVDGTFRQL